MPKAQECCKTCTGNNLPYPHGKRERPKMAVNELFDNDPYFVQNGCIFIFQGTFLIKIF